jgi:hypothetical protein
MPVCRSSWCGGPCSACFIRGNNLQGRRGVPFAFSRPAASRGGGEEKAAYRIWTPQAKNISPFNMIALSGKSLFSVKPHLKKYSDFQNDQISCINMPSRPTQRGVSRSSRTLGAGCGGRERRLDECAMRGRPSRVVLTPRGRRQPGGLLVRPGTVSKKPDHRGEHEATVNHCAGKAGCFRRTCGDYACVLFSFARKAAGASSARLSLRPLL